MARIINKTELRELLYNEGYEKIIFEVKEDGKIGWDVVSTGYCCYVNDEGERVYPDHSLNRIDFYNTTRKAVDLKLAELEAEL